MDYIPNFSRRTMLRGLGATLTLPWLESLVWADEGTKAVQSGPPRRFAAVVFANGVVPDRWWAKEAADGLEFSDCLAPLTAYARDVTFFDNLRLVKNPPYVVPHGTHYANFLSGYPVKKQAVPQLAITLDQYLASFVRKDTVVPALNLGLRFDNSATALNGTISWANATTPVMPEIFPARAFDSLFDVTGKLRDRSVLDDVFGQAQLLRGKLSRDDQHKLDEYMTSIREVERRIDQATNDERVPGVWRPALEKPDMPRPKDGQPQDIPEYMRLMVDILVLAFRMDRTRVATLQFNNDGTNDMRCGFIPGVPNEEHHSISHHSDKPERIEHCVKTIAYHTSQFAYLLERMKAAQEGDGTLLDNSMALFGTNFINGHTHDTSKLPLLLAGRGGHSIQPGKVIRTEKDDDRAACNLYLSLLNRMGVPDKAFGDSTHPIDLG
jgi:hypothetical protein